MSWFFAGAVMVVLVIVIFTHYVLSDHKDIGKALKVVEIYALPFLVAIVSKSIGAYKAFKVSGLTASFWAIIIGMVLHSSGVKMDGQVKSGEYFIKIGVTLLVMDYTNIISIGGPGLVVAWVDTAIILTVGYYFASKVMGLCAEDAVVLAGATTICGSSAATAIATVVYPGESDHEKKARGNIVDPIVALMGLLNTPLMTLLPIANTAGSLNAGVTGAWIGGCIDSTGQVVASASLSTDAVLQTATIVKIAQNFLIGPVCLVLTLLFHSHSERESEGLITTESRGLVATCSRGLQVIFKQFPVFVLGFFITSAAVTVINHIPSIDQTISDKVIDNSWDLAEWINLVGFACIGLKIDALSLFHTSKHGDGKKKLILKTYAVIQSLDILSTLAFAYLMFRNSNIDDDSVDDDNN
jgi:uncharacterized membrane protein YadS